MDFIISDENDISIKCREKQIGVKVLPPPPFSLAKTYPKHFVSKVALTFAATYLTPEPSCSIVR